MRGSERATAARRSPSGGHSNQTPAGFAQVHGSILSLFAPIVRLLASLNFGFVLMERIAAYDRAAEQEMDGCRQSVAGLCDITLLKTA
jgi:hypothetical protein